MLDYHFFLYTFKYIFIYIIDNQQLKHVQLVIYSHTLNSNNKIHVIYVYYTKQHIYNQYLAHEKGF